ncbi:MAG: PDZ domain-containing protein [Candidatus Eremiobacterota bacterium]
MQVYDVLVEVDGKPVQDVSALRNLLAESRPGQDVRFRLLRKGRPVEVRVPVVVRPVDPAGRPLQGI